jgi:hypothetical protein
MFSTANAGMNGWKTKAKANANQNPRKRNKIPGLGTTLQHIPEWKSASWIVAASDGVVENQRKCQFVAGIGSTR